MKDLFNRLEVLGFIIGLIALLSRFETLGTDHIVTAVGAIAVIYLGTRVI